MKFQLKPGRNHPFIVSELTPTAIVVGSGPSGVSCSWSLLQAGWKVTMLDVGMSLEAAQAEKLTELQAVNPDAWNGAPEAAFLREGISAGANGIPLKLAYGSNFPYRSVSGATAVACEGVHTQPSLARGGFSNVWGSAMLPYRQHDLGKWPIGEADLAPHYRAVLEHVPVAGREDDLAEYFPLYGVPERLPVSAQAGALLQRIRQNRTSLAAQKIVAGASRLAVRNTPSSPCRACGLCMYGCPSSLIYCSSSSVDELLCHPNFTYSSGHYVTRVVEQNGAASLAGFDVDSRAKIEVSADRIFLACGTVATTAILLRSLEAWQKPVTMLDSQYFLLPSATTAGAGSVTSEHLHTLSQAFIEVMDEKVSSYTLHFQVYTYNELYSQAIDATARALRTLVPKDFLLSRLLLLQGYLHSDESPSMSCVLEKDATGDTLQISRSENPVTRFVMRKAREKLLRASGASGLIPLLPLLRPGLPGRGFHSGGTFPMKLKPAEFESDIYGRPAGFQRIHAVDSTVFSSIPATTITFTAMANAHRIGELAAQL
jgi:ferredoxin